MTPRLIPAPASNVLDHEALHGRLPERSADELVELARATHLSGRGGAGFPLHRKLAAVIDAADRRRRSPVVVANGAEGEPLSAKDRFLLTTSPHLVLDGIALAARATGAERAHLVTHPDLVPALTRAVHERGVHVEIHAAPRRFVAGQASAVSAIVEGRPALPSGSGIHLSERGVGRRPTLVSNVETLAQFAVLARLGVERFTSVGTPEQPGTALVTTSGPDGRLFVDEFAYGTAMSQVLGAAHVDGGHVLLGGYHGTWARARDVVGLTFDDASLAAVAARAGGIVHDVGPGQLARATGEILAYLDAQSARQCGPCVKGLPALHDAWQRWTAGDPRAEQHLEVLAEVLPGRGACAHPDGAVRMAMSAYRLLREDARELVGTARIGGAA